MSANEIYEIVKDVPKAAWPSMVDERWFPRGNKPDREAGSVALMFEASMMKWLMGCGHFAFYSKTDHVFRVGRWNHSEFISAPTLIEALAAACKGVTA